MQAVSKFFNYLIPVSLFCLVIFLCVLVFYAIKVLINVSKILENLEDKLVDVDPAIKVVNKVFGTVDKGMIKGNNVILKGVNASKNVYHSIKKTTKKGISAMRGLLGRK